MLKQTVVYYYCFFANFEPLIAQRGELWDSNTYQNLKNEEPGGLYGGLYVPYEIFSLF